MPTVHENVVIGAKQKCGIIYVLSEVAFNLHSHLVSSSTPVTAVQHTLIWKQHFLKLLSDSTCIFHRVLSNNFICHCGCWMEKLVPCDLYCFFN
jgi:hypothetical protein